jgi:hypothetical protein
VTGIKHEWSVVKIADKVATTLDLSVSDSSPTQLVVERNENSIDVALERGEVYAGVEIVGVSVD